MNHKGTSASIVNAAEILFAEQGFTETTVRQITSRADVNLAAINYHFGSKKGLIQAVAEKFLTPLCAELGAMLDQRQLAEGAGQITLEELLEMLMRTLLIVNRDNVNALAVFMRLLELSYMKNQEELRQFLMTRYNDKLQPFISLLRQDPNVTLLMDAETMVEVITGQKDGMSAFMTGSLRAEGNVMLATKLGKLFSREKRR